MLTPLFVMSTLSFANTPAEMSIIGGDPTEDFAAVGTIVALTAEGRILADFCSGTLIDEDIVVTAAHCVEAFSDFEHYGAQGFAFLIGTTLYEDDGIWDYGIIDGLAAHPDYDPQTLANDIAVLQLTEAITTTTPMPVQSATPSLNQQVTYVGWGKTDEYDDYSTGVKQTVTIPIQQVTNAHIITYDPMGRNICNGDSGGAALMVDSMGNYSLAGVNSFGFDVYGRAPHCGGDGAAGGAVRVDAYLDWIEDTIDADFGEPGAQGGGGAGTTEHSSNSVFPAGNAFSAKEKTCATSRAQSSWMLGLLGLLAWIRRQR